MSKAFEQWWERVGQFVDPDTADVPWYDKRKDLAALAFAAASPLQEPGFELAPAAPPREPAPGPGPAPAAPALPVQGTRAGLDMMRSYLDAASRNIEEAQRLRAVARDILKACRAAIAAERVRSKETP